MSARPFANNPASADAESVPDALLDALLGVFAARGFDGASLAELARASGRSKASLYHHFPGGKQAMLATLVARCVADLQQRAFQPLLDAAPQQAAGGKRKKTDRAAALEAIGKFIDGFADYLAANQGHCLLATLALTQPEMLGREHSAQTRRWLDLLALTCERAGHKPKAARRVAQSVLARLYGNLLLEAMGTELSAGKARKWLKKELVANL